MPRLPAGFPEPIEEVRLAGGDVGDVWRIAFAEADPVVVKHPGTDARLEAEGLEALRRAGAPTPDVIAVDRDVLVLEYVAGPGDLEALGRAVATVHRTTADRFGWHHDNVIGPLWQANTWSANWHGFYAARRLAPHLDALPAVPAGRIRSAIDDGRVEALLDHDAPPSLVHGDLWAGNVVGERWLIDPAVHYADRELDLAMLALFGGVPDTFAQGYDEVWPLDDGWEARRPALQLYHLLVHVRLFGSGYQAAVTSRLHQLGW